MATNLKGERAPAYDWLQLIQGEYLESPGLNLTKPQVQRLWGLDPLTCDALLDELVDDPQVVANNYIDEFTAEDGRQYKLVAAPVEFNETPATMRRAPRVGEHTEEILRGLGVGADDMAAYRKSGTIG